jgi:uncharacterized repeat protein (TIGR01451 family)
LVAAGLLTLLAKPAQAQTADLTVTKVGKAVARTGETVRYYPITVTNNGPDPLTVPANTVLLRVELTGSTISSAAYGGPPYDARFIGTAPFSAIEFYATADDVIPAGGTLTFMVDANPLSDPGTITNTATVNPNGAIQESNEANNSASVTTTVVNNTAPVANDDSYTAAQDAPLTVEEPGVVANDTDLTGDQLSPILVAGPSNGTLRLNRFDGSFTYTPNPGFTGTDSFTYKASDGDAESNVATVTITVGASARPDDDDDLIFAGAGGARSAGDAGGAGGAGGDGGTGSQHQNQSQDQDQSATATGSTFDATQTGYGANMRAQ